MDKNELEKLIEQVLAEKMSIKLPDMPEKFSDEYGIDDYVADLNNTLGVDNKDFPGSGKKSMADPNQYIKLVRDIEKADVFDFQDVRALKTAPQTPITQKNPQRQPTFTS